MRSTNRKRALLMSTSVILLCMTVIVGMTWALFTDTKIVQNHLKAGDLTITLKRTELLKTSLNNGFLVEPDPDNPDRTVVNFTEPTDKNVFGLATNAEGEVTEKIVPGSWYVAKMQITNQGDVAFGYWLEVECGNADVAKALAKQLKITVYRDLNGDGRIDMNTESVTTDCTVSTGLSVRNDHSNDGYIGVVACNGSEDFIVKVEFEDLGYTYQDGVLTSGNDEAQLNEVDFDLVICAVQVTTAPNP